MNAMKPKAQGERTGGNISKPEVISMLLHFCKHQVLDCGQM